LLSPRAGGDGGANVNSAAKQRKIWRPEENTSSLAHLAELLFHFFNPLLFNRSTLTLAAALPRCV
jgi:hypothetical protein